MINVIIYVVAIAGALWYFTGEMLYVGGILLLGAGIAVYLKLGGATEGGFAAPTKKSEPRSYDQADRFAKASRPMNTYGEDEPSDF
jgi:hypothetical protein